MSISVPREKITSFEAYKATFGGMSSSYDPSILEDLFREFLIVQVDRKEDSTPWQPIALALESSDSSHPLDHYAFLISLSKDELEQFSEIEENLMNGNYEAAKVGSPKLLAKAYLGLPLSQRISLSKDFASGSGSIIQEHPLSKQQEVGRRLQDAINTLPQNSLLKPFLSQIKTKEVPLSKLRQHVVNALQVFAQMLGKTPSEIDDGRYDLSLWSEKALSFIYEKFLNSFGESLPPEVTTIRDSRKNTLEDKIRKSNNLKLKGKDLSGTIKKEHYEAAFESGPLSSLRVGLFWDTNESFSEQWETKRGLERLYVDALVELGSERGISLDKHCLLQNIEVYQDARVTSFSEAEVKACLQKKIGALRKACKLPSSPSLSFYQQYAEFKQEFRKLYSSIQQEEGSLKALFLQEAYLAEDTGVILANVPAPEKVEDNTPPPPPTRELFDSLEGFKAWMTSKKDTHSPMRAFFEEKGLNEVSLERAGLGELEKVDLVNQTLDLFKSRVAHGLPDAQMASVYTFKELDAAAIQAMEVAYDQFLENLKKLNISCDVTKHANKLLAEKIAHLKEDLRTTIKLISETCQGHQKDLKLLLDILKKSPSLKDPLFVSALRLVRRGNIQINGLEVNSVLDEAMHHGKDVFLGALEELHPNAQKDEKKQVAPYQTLLRILECRKVSSDILWYGPSILKRASEWLEARSFKDSLEGVDVSKSPKKAIDQFQEKVEKEIDRLELPIIYKDLLQKAIDGADLDNLQKIWEQVSFARYNKALDEIIRRENDPDIEDKTACENSLKILKAKREEWKTLSLSEKIAKTTELMDSLGDVFIGNYLLFQLKSLPLNPVPPEKLKEHKESVFTTIASLPEDSPLRKYLYASRFTMVGDAETALAWYSQIHAEIIRELKARVPANSVLQTQLDMTFLKDVFMTDQLMRFVEEKKPVTIANCCNFGFAYALEKLLKNHPNPTQAANECVKQFHEMARYPTQMLILHRIWRGKVLPNENLLSRLLSGPGQVVGFEFARGVVAEVYPEEITTFMRNVIFQQDQALNDENNSLISWSIISLKDFQEWFGENKNSLLIKNLQEKGLLDEKGQIIAQFSHRETASNIQEACLTLVDLMRLKDGARELIFPTTELNGKALLSTAEEWLQKEKQGKASRCSKEELREIFYNAYYPKPRDESSESSLATYLSGLSFLNPLEDQSAEEYYLANRTILDQIYSNVYRTLMAIQQMVSGGSVCYPEVVGDYRSVALEAKQQTYNLDRSQIESIVNKVLFTMYEMNIEKIQMADTPEVKKRLGEQRNPSNLLSPAERIQKAINDLPFLGIQSEVTRQNIEQLLTKASWKSLFDSTIDQVWEDMKKTPIGATLPDQEASEKLSSSEKYIIEIKRKQTLTCNMGTRIRELELPPYYNELLELAARSIKPDFFYWLCQKMSYLMFISISEDEVPAGEPTFLAENVKKSLEILEKDPVANQEKIDLLVKWKGLL